MAQNESSKVSYFNTLIFTIIAGIISLLLVLALFSDVGKKNMYLIITVEVGIFSVIAICIYQIVVNEKLASSRKNYDSERISFKECPDYYTKSIEDNSTICKNMYRSTDKFNNEYVLRFYPVDTQPLETVETASGKCDFTDRKVCFDLDSIEKESKFTNAKKECAYIVSEPVANLNGATADDVTKFAGYSKLPWTYATSRCEQYIDSN
jgi:hypothetical protein